MEPKLSEICDQAGLRRAFFEAANKLQAHTFHIAIAGKSRAQSRISEYTPPNRVLPPGRPPGLRGPYRSRQAA